MKELGFLIWRLNNIRPIDDTIEKLLAVGARWVSIKVRDGSSNFNYYDADGRWTGNPDYLSQVIQKMKAAGLEVGGWQFVYTDRMKQQAEAARAAVSTFGLSHWLIDAEEYAPLGAMWKQDPAAASKAQQYMDNLQLPAGVEVGLCSYRFPSVHRPFPFGTFMRHRASTITAPQVYWMLANNPGAQLERSKREHDAIHVLPMVPIGASFREHGWEPGPGEIREFITTARRLGMPAWGFWDLDEALYREDWLTEMAGVPLPPPPPAKEPEMGQHTIYHVETSGLNVRDNIIPSRVFGKVPGKVYRSSKVWFTLSEGSQVEALEEVTDGPNVWVRVGQRQFVAKIYDNTVFLK